MLSRPFLIKTILLWQIPLLMVCSPFNDPYPPNDINFKLGIVPDTVTNWEQINTVWDDMNMPGPPTLHYDGNLFLSTNRFTQGGTFDLVHFECQAIFNQVHGQFGLYAGPQTKCRNDINSPGNEFGPYIVSSDYRNWNAPLILFFASDRNNQDSTGLNIYMTHPVSWDDLLNDSSATPLPVVKAAALNSKYDDAYIAFGPNNTIYFCSNREGNFHIYSCAIPWDIYQNQDSVFNLLADSSANLAITKDIDLNSNQDDKCPYILGNTMFFVSNRSGGFGGFDIYRSAFANGKWSTPVNLGERVNSIYDEYRPACLRLDNYVNWLLVFSSNRPGGKGGYDIYYTGVDTLQL
ncbi:MAG: hypothetical protein PHG23_02800 [Candidatus Pacebacteria bacterium]|nr:hypothetical protein [Candidatus Paceibacterota bacterium]